MTSGWMFPIEAICHLHRLCSVLPLCTPLRRPAGVFIHVDSLAGRNTSTATRLAHVLATHAGIAAACLASAGDERCSRVLADHSCLLQFLGLFFSLSLSALNNHCCRWNWRHFVAPQLQFLCLFSSLPAFNNHRCRCMLSAGSTVIPLDARFMVHHQSTVTNLFVRFLSSLACLPESPRPSGAYPLLHAWAPQQPNGCDCGLFALEAARRLCCAAAAATAAAAAAAADATAAAAAPPAGITAGIVDGGCGGNGGGDGDGDGEGERAGSLDEEEGTAVRVEGACKGAVSLARVGEAPAIFQSAEDIEAVLCAQVPGGYMDEFRQSIRELIRNKANEARSAS